MTWIGSHSCWSLLCAFTLAGSAAPARAQVDPLPLRVAHHPHRVRLSVSAASPADTTYVGFTPGHSADNYWSIWSGTGAENFHHPPAQNGMWGFEGPYDDVHQDSLQGWWPYRLEMTGSGGLTFPDYQRPWSALDFGNDVSYVGNFGPGPDGRKRTFGVVGAWHVDGGNTIVAPGATTWSGEPANSGGVMWAPLEGASSVWMGLRRHGDNAYLDPITGNAFNEDLLQYHHSNSASQGGTDAKFPGYGGQMDQLLYRDVQLAAGDTSLTISFKYRTALSTAFSTSNSTRRGWFVHDPVTVTTGGSNPNFISNNSTNPSPPVDSLMLYVGAPAEGSVILSDGQSHAIYDVQRRWFGEVIRSNEGLYKELFSKGGTVAATPTTVSIGGASLAALKAAAGGRLRLVFRVKTNHFSDDTDFNLFGFSSGGVGAAIVDDVNLGLNGASPAGGFAGAVQGGFNASADIDDDPGTDALLAWKSTGKPPQQYFHVHDLSKLRYDDVCGPVGSATRQCDLTGVVLSIGDHDRNDETGHEDHPYEMEPWDRVISPTIQLCGPYTGAGGRNRMGMTAAQVQGAADLYVDYEIYGAAFQLFTYGNHWQFGIQAYPAGSTGTGAGQHARWGEIRYPGFTLFSGDAGCFRDLEASRGNGMLKTTNATGTPDSVRVIFRRMQEAYRFGIANAVTDVGGYLDNFSLTLIAQPPPPALSVDTWQWLQDTFPFNDSPGIAGTPAAFDTTSALVKTGLNNAPLTGNTSRFDVPGDSTVVQAPGANVRVDLVFRILPGPGNYVDASNGANSQLRAVPTSTAPIPTPAPGVANFWSNYLYANGTHGTPGGHPIATSGPLAGQKVWSPLVWNSARCDTAEVNQFLPGGYARYLGQGPDPNLFMSAYHEEELADPHRGVLGITRNVCFTADTTVFFPIKTICGSGPMPPGVTYPPAWASTPGSGFDGHTTTREGTKIIPDGLLTPGSHVEYFYRREDVGGGNVVLEPDTTVATQDDGDGFYDLGRDPHRWQQFSVLPDRWKSPLYLHPLLGVPGTEPCMLVVEQAPGDGDMYPWNVLAEALGMTAASKRGAGTGLAAPVDGDPNDPAGFVHTHLGQAGTTWDLYTVRGGQSSTVHAGDIGSRYAFRDSTNTQIYGKRSRQGPTNEMLATYYRMITLLGGKATFPIGPANNQSQNEAGVLGTWLASGSTSTPNRGLLMQGESIGENLAANTASAAFASNSLGVMLRDGWYQHLSGNSSRPFDLTPGAAVSPRSDRFALSVTCPGNPDVLDFSAALASETVDAGDYGPAGAGPYMGSVLKPRTAAHPWIALTNAWQIGDLYAPASLVSDRGRLAYYADVFTNVFGAICPQVVNPVGVGSPVAALTPFLRVDGNPVRDAGATRIRFALASAGRAEVRLYDVAGRMVRVLARQTFAAGEHALPWDGRDMQSRPLAHGVYFVRIEQPGSFTDVRKLVVLGP